MTKKLAIAAALLALPLGVAYAGSKNTSNAVYVNVGGSASGSLGQARNSTDTVEYIGCYTTAYTSRGTSGACYARDQFNNFVVCSVPSTAATLVTEIQSMPSDAYLVFTFDAQANCTSIQVTNLSTLAPKWL